MPPREGREPFISAMSAAGENGIRAIVYMNQALWETTTESWKSENAAPALAKDVNGKPSLFSMLSTTSMRLPMEIIPL